MVHGKIFDYVFISLAGLLWLVPLSSLSLPLSLPCIYFTCNTSSFSHFLDFIMLGATTVLLANALLGYG